LESFAFLLVVLMRPQLTEALNLAKSLPAEELPAFLGELEQIRITALARITTPATQPGDTLLEVPEAAARLGMSPDYLYRHSKKLPFTRRIGRALRFSSAGIDTYLKRAR
jgi:excisionase family DNA binding protein